MARTLPVPLQTLRELAVLPSPDGEQVRALLPDDGDATAVTDLLAGRTVVLPETPDAPAAPTAPDTPRHPDRRKGSKGTTVASSGKSTGSSTGKLSLAEQLKRRRTGGLHVTVDPADFETDPEFREVFAELDDTYGYRDPEGFTSPGPVRVRTEKIPAGADGEDAPGSVLVTWPALPGRPKDTTLYRVIAADREVDRAPGAGRELVITHGTAFRDTRPSTSGFRHYMVWAYTWDGNIDGLFTADALFIGEDVAIFPPRNFRIAESGGIVTGSWDALPGHSEIRVYRAPKGYAGRLNDSGHQLTDGLEQSSFTHRVATRGLTYEFCLAPVVTFRDRARTGDPTPALEKQVSAEIQQVELTTAELLATDNEDNILLAWTAPPTGFVRIFLTAAAPNPELPIQAIDKEYLDDDDALGTTDLVFDDTSAPGADVLRTRPWPTGWHQVYVTLVNIVEERAWVGDSEVLQKVDVLAEPRLIERVANQLVTFDWPGGADFVDITTRERTFRLEETAYRRQGGARLNLSADGEPVALMPKAIYDGEEKTAAGETVIDYPGLRVYSYDLAYPDTPWLRIWSVGHPDANAPHFRLVYRPDRLPLSVTDGDGDPLTCLLDDRASRQEIRPTPDIHRQTLTNELGEAGGAAGTAVTNAVWQVVDPRVRAGGYLRLFIDDRTPEQDTTDRTAPGESWGSPAQTGPSGPGARRSAFGRRRTDDTPTTATTGVPGSAGTSGQTATPTPTVPAVIVEGDVATRLRIPLPTPQAVPQSVEQPAPEVQP